MTFTVDGDKLSLSLSGEADLPWRLTAGVFDVVVKGVRFYNVAVETRVDAEGACIRPVQHRPVRVTINAHGWVDINWCDGSEKTP